MNNLLFPRRQFLRSLTAGSMLLPGIVRQLLAADGAATAGPHFPAKARINSGQPLSFRLRFQDRDDSYLMSTPLQRASQHRHRVHVAYESRDEHCVIAHLIRRQIELLSESDGDDITYRAPERVLR